MQPGQDLCTSLLDSCADAVFVLDPSGRILQANRAAVGRYGHSLEQLLSMNARDLAPERLHGQVGEKLRAALEGSAVFEWAHRRVDGSEFPVEIGAAFAELDGRRVIISTVRDISQRRQDEVRIRRLIRTHAMLSGLRKIMLRERDRQTLLVGACRIAVQEGGFRMAWVGLADPESGKVIPVASEGVTDGYLERLDISLAETPRGAGPTGRALRAGQHMVCNDIADDPAMEPWREDALALGYRASAAFPLAVRGRTVGAFNLYAGEAGFFDGEKLRLLDELAMDISFALEMIQGEQERQEAERARRESEALQRALLQYSLDAILLTTPDGRILSANPAACRLFGRSEVEICEVGRAGLLDTGDPRLAALLRQRAETGWTLGTVAMLRRDETRFEGEICSAIFETAGGPRTSMIIRDVTERQRLNDELQRAVLCLELAEELAMMGAGSWSWRSDGASGPPTCSACRAWSPPVRPRTRTPSWSGCTPRTAM